MTINAISKVLPKHTKHPSQFKGIIDKQLKLHQIIMQFLGYKTKYVPISTILLLLRIPFHTTITPAKYTREPRTKKTKNRP